MPHKSRSDKKGHGPKYTSGLGQLWIPCPFVFCLIFQFNWCWIFSSNDSVAWYPWTCVNWFYNNHLSTIFNWKIYYNLYKLNSDKKTSLVINVFYGKKIQSALHQFVYVSVLWSFFRKHARLRSQKMAYIFVQRRIFPLILAYAIWNKHHNIGQLALYLHI